MALLEGPSHRVALANPAFRRLVGGRDVLGRDVAEALPEAAEQGFVALLDQVRATGETHLARGAPYAFLDGGAAVEKRVDFVYQPMRGADGAVSDIFVAGHDVTEAHAAQEALRAGEARGRFLLALQDALRPLADPVAVEAAAAEALGRHLGADRALYVEVEPDGDAVVIHRDYAPRAQSLAGRSRFSDFGGHYAAAYLAGETQVVPEVTADGRLSEAEQAAAAALGVAAWVGVPLLKDGRLRAVLAVHQSRPRAWTPAEVALVEEVAERTWDAVERARAEAALRELNRTLEERVAERTRERETLARIVETTGASVQALDAHHRWIVVNDAAAAEYASIYGRSPAPGESLLDYLADRPEHLGDARAVWDRALAGEAFSTVAEFGDPRLSRRAYEMIFEVLRDDAGAVAGAFMTGWNVTDRLRDQARLLEAEDQLRQAQKMEAIGQLTGGVAHDFNNLLTPIMGGLDILHRRGVGGPRERRLIEGALQSAERARTLVSRLLAFARRQPLLPGPVDLADLVEGLRDLVGSTAGPQVRLVIEAEAAMPPATADRNQLEMAVLNLAVNARDAMPEGGTLTVAVRLAFQGAPEGVLLPCLRLVVADTGTGMDADTRARATEPFFSTKGVGQGTGLGLSMVHGLVAQLGGAMTIDSAPGRGTEVALWLPVSTEPAGSRPREAALPGPEGGTALLVDDEDAVRAATRAMLADLGYDVTEAASAEAALALVEGGLAPDVLVTDYLMAGMTGADLARALRASHPDLPVLVVTGYADAAALPLGLPRLFKPFRRDELARRLVEARR
jgi:signal transduction histidine kinase/CheY-like chemotaxis protein